ncbi:MAG: protein phosphatase 2C domain-containing protein [Actinomycetota bacterium]|nr:protein phosphatase 2C domain-containing protein [Actinomycetota bacterium]
MGGTALGASHREAGLPCQDSAGWWSGPLGGSTGVMTVAAVADGAGSARLAALGSQSAVTEVLRLVRCLAGELPPASDDDRSFLSTAESPDNAAAGAEATAVVMELFAAARRALEAAAHEAEADLRDLATTLIVALATPDSLVIGEVGDGVVAVSIGGAVIGPLTPQRGEFANETAFLTGGEVLPEVSLASFPSSEVEAFAISSDGLRLLITSNSLEGTPHAPFFDDLFAGVASGVTSEALTQFLEQAEDRTGDDKSLVVGVRVP